MEIKPYQQASFVTGTQALDASVFLIYGQDSSGRSNIQKKLLANLNANWANNEAEILTFYEDEVNADNNKFVTECTSLGFFSAKKIVILNTSTNQLAPMISEIADNIIEDCKIIIFSGSLDAKSKLRALSKKNNLIALPRYKIESKDANVIVREELTKRNINVGNDIVSLITEKLASKPANIPSEIEKLALYTNASENITLEQVESCFCEYSALEINDLCHAILLKDNKQINKIADNLELNESAIQLARILSNITQKLIDINTRAQSSNVQNAIEQTRPFVFYKDKPTYSKILRGVQSNQDLHKILNLSYNIEMKAKTNYGIKNKELLSLINTNL